MFDRPVAPFHLVVLHEDPALAHEVGALLTRGFTGRLKIHAFLDARAARQWLDAHPCDILLTDLDLPEPHGLELVRYARQRNPWTQAILLASRFAWDGLAAALEQGTCDYVPKPVDPADLRRVLENVCERLTRWRTIVAHAWREQAEAVLSCAP